MSLIYKHTSGGELYQAGAAEISEILKNNKNITVLVLAAREFQPKIVGKNINIIRLALEDTSNMSPEQLKDTISKAVSAAQIVAKTLERGESALVTCKMGWNRSGLVNGLAISMLCNDCDRDQIIKQIKKKRSLFALSNPLFRKVIRAY